MRASYSTCIAFFHLGSNNASKVVDGSKMLWVVKKGLGLKILTFALVMMLWVDVIALDFGIVVEKKGGIHDRKREPLIAASISEVWKLLLGIYIVHN